MALHGKTALITGSSRGIGRGIALKLASQGVKTAITYYTQKDLANETLAKVRACGGDGFVMQVDVTHPDEIHRMFDRIKQDKIQIALASSAKKDELKKYKEIAEIDDLIESETSSDNVERSKPCSDIFDAALKQLVISLPRTSSRWATRPMTQRLQPKPT